MQVVIPAAGEGSRLFPWTAAIPKPLLPIAGKPLLVRIVEKLQLEGLGPRITVTCLSEYKDQFEYHLKWSDDDEVEVYSHDRPFGTAGELAFLGELSGTEQLEEEFMVYFADIWTEHNLTTMVNRWKWGISVDMLPIALLGVAPKLQVDKGVPVIENHKILKLQEKPDLDVPNLAGIGIFKKDILRYAKLGEDLHRDAIPAALKAGEDVAAYEITEGYTDVGSFTSFKAIQRTFKSSPRTDV